MENSESNAEVFVFPPGLMQSAGFLLNRLGRRLREQLNVALEPLKITTQELGLMRIIHDQGPLSQQALGKRNLTDRTTIVHLLDQLEQREFVVRVRNQSDKRSHLLFLTPRGKKTLARAIKITNREQADFLAPLSVEEWNAVQTQLVKLLQHHERI